MKRLKTADGFACQSDRSRSLDKDVGYNSVAGSDIPSVMASLSSVTYICLFKVTYFETYLLQIM